MALLPHELLTEARQQALETRRCIACDKPLRLRKKYICGHDDCRRYYFKLWTIEYRVYDPVASANRGGGRYKRRGSGS